MGGRKAATRKAGKSLRRRVGVRSPRRTFVIFCEGERTEPDYLSALKQEPQVRQAAAVDLRIERTRHGAGPLRLVQKAVEARRRALMEDAEIDEFWCVFDVEWPVNHPGIQKAVELAQREGIHLAISNPCFELWLVLHFTDHTSWLDNDAARRLRRQCDGKQNKGLDGTQYMSLRTQAVGRARALDDRHDRTGSRLPNNNPSSGMHLLIAAVESTNPS